MLELVLVAFAAVQETPPLVIIPQEPFRPGPTAAEFLNHFVSASTGAWRLGSWSPYRAAGTDAKDVGANIAAIPK